MAPNPFVGVIFHWIGGLASASFYVPYKRVRHWSWETYWIVGGFFGWIVCPTLFALLLTNDLFAVIRQQSLATLFWTFLFGALWGVGAATFGLTMRYLGLSLGMGVALGLCAAFGTLVPPLAKSLIPSIPLQESLGDIASTSSGKITLAGVGVCLLGIAISALAGLSKERNMTAEAKSRSIGEFNFPKGIFVATVSGILSACFAFALTAAAPMASASAAAGTPTMWTGLPKLVVMLVGGFATNAVWCGILNRRNRTGREYLATRARPVTAAAEEIVPRAANYLWCAAAGTTWYLQFFFYTIGETKIGPFSFASWSLHMASIIIFANAWGTIFREWKGAGRAAHWLLVLGVVTLVGSTLIIGYGAYVKMH